MSVEGRDSSYFRPTLEQARAARAAGVRIWWGYFGSRDGLGLATRWSREDFAVVQEAGLVAGGFCSGYDDPEWIRATAVDWRILACVDAEPGIRDDGEGGNWIPDWVARAQSGLYGLASVHYHAGEPIGRGAQFNIVANYLNVGCTGETWPSWLPRPARPAWQCRGTYDEFGGSVDRGIYDDWFLGGANVAIDPQEIDHIRNSVDEQWDFAVSGWRGDRQGLLSKVSDKVDQLLEKVGAPAAVDPQVVNDAVAAALADHPLTSILSDDDRQAVADAVLQRISQGFAQAAGPKP